MLGTRSPVESLRHERSAQAVRRIRSSIIGRQQHAKAECIQQGLLSALRLVLTEKAHHHTVTETAYLISALAREGPTFVDPILKSRVLESILQYLPEKDQLRQQLAILRCLNSVADNLPPKVSGQWPEDTSLADLLYTQEYASALIEGIQNASGSLISQQICDLVIGLVCRTCKSETQKRMVVELGMLKVLGYRLASFVVADGLVVPSPEALDFPSSAGFGLADPAPANAHLSPTLEAIAVLIEGSKDRAQALLSDHVLSTVLPQSRDEFFGSDNRALASMHGSSVNVPRSRHRELDGLLPYVPVKEKHGSASTLNFPPLGSGGPLQRRRPSFQPAQPQALNVNFVSETQQDRDEKALIPYLLLIAREARGRRRLLACKVLVTLYALRLVPASRSETFGALLVPLLVRMLDQTESKDEFGATNPGLYMADGTHYTKAAPATLGILIMDDADLQKAAVEAGAIAKLAAGLKASFDTPSGRKNTPWRPTKEISMANDDLSQDCSLGNNGPPSNMRQDMTYRQGLLQALAAIAPFNDDYRKQICDQGVLTQIMQSMEPFQVKASTAAQQEATGNSAPTILAACGTIRALTRSVTALRTKLVDAEVAKSVIRLMNNPDPEVRIAATKVLANLAMDFSPMKESVGDAAVVKKLCEQAHSANARLRLESLWALKQLVVNASRSQKIDVVNELGSSWVRLLIRTDPYDIPEGEVIGLIVDKEYPARLESSDDVVMSEDSEGEGSDFFQEAGARISGPDGDFNRHTPEDDLAIQEQVLDLLRNLFCGDTASDLVDYVLGQMGKAEFFDILRKRLSGKKLYGATRRETVENPAPVGIVSKVLYVVVHIAACSQRWRRSLVNETALLKIILGFCNHSEREIRAQICWLAINLMFEDDASDKASCRQRAIELTKAGFREKIAKLENDADLDVRERAKTAMHLFSSLLDAR